LLRRIHSRKRTVGDLVEPLLVIVDLAEDLMQIGQAVARALRLLTKPR
jgi:hypothetical protein